MDGNSESVRTGRSLGLHACGLIGAAGILFFHPGAMDMDRLKSNMLLLLLVPVAAGAVGPRRLVQSAAHPLPRALGLAALLTLLLLAKGLVSTCLFTEGLFVTAGILMLVLLVRSAGEEADRRPLVIPFWIVAAGTLAAAFALFQAAGLDPFYRYNPSHEPVSTLGNTNELAEVMALLIPLVLALLLSERLWLLPALPLLTAGLWVSGGRGGILAAVAGSALVLFLHWRSGKRSAPRYLLIGLALAVGMVLGLIVGSRESLALKKIDSSASIFSADYPTNRARIEIWKSTLGMIGDHPVLGVGAGQFRVAFPPYRNPEEARMPGLLGAATEVRDPHNEYLWSAAEGGLVAAGLFVLLLVAAVRGASFWVGTVAAFAVLSLFRSPLHNPAAAVILFLSLARMEVLPAPRRLKVQKAIALPLIVLLAVATWVRAGPGLLSDWIAASAAMHERLGPEEFEAFQRAADMDPTHIDMINFVGQTAANRLMGTEADREGRYRLIARERLGQVLKLNPYQRDALRTLAKVRAFEGDMNSARRLLERYNRIMGAEESAEKTLMEWVEEFGGHKKAAQLLLASSGGDPQPLLHRAEALFDRGEAATAAVYADQYLVVRPFDGDALYLLGRCLRILYDEGEKDVFRRMHIAYALEWMEQGDLNKAARSIRSSLRYGEGGGEARLLEAVIKAEEGGDFLAPAVEVKNEAFLDRLEQLKLRQDYFFHLR